MDDIDHGYITTQNEPPVAIHYAEMNNQETNPLVLFLHGFPENWLAWREYFSPLASEGYHVVSIDLRGYNRSSRPHRIEDYKLEKLVSDVVNVLHHFKKKINILVGHDWGGLISWELARSYPELLSGLVILNAPLPMAASENLKKDRGLLLTQALKSLYVGLFQLPKLPERLLRVKNFALLERAFFTANKGCIIPKDVLTLYKNAFEGDGALSSSLNYYRANFPGRLNQSFHLISVRTLFIWGEEDAFIDGRLNTGLERFFSHPPIFKTYKASHWVHWEEREKIITDLISFIRALPRELGNDLRD